MNIKTTSTGISVHIILFEDIDFYAFEEEFKSFLDKHPDFLSLPIYVQFKKDIEGSIPEMSIFIDSLKDMDVFISGIITENKGLRRFASYLAIPNFVSVELIHSAQPKIQAQRPNHPPVPPTQPTVAQIPKISAQEQKILTNPQPQQEQAYRKLSESLYKPTNDTKPTLDKIKPNPQPNRPSPQPNVVESPTPKPVIKIDPYENRGLTQPDKKPLIVQENITVENSIKHDGDIIILGEVEPGAVVSATGSIHCYNRTDGTLLAGSSGNAKARIYALQLNAVAVALAGYYAKRHQYKHILNQSNLMISLNRSDLNFNTIEKLPSIVKLTTEHAGHTPPPQITTETIFKEAHVPHSPSVSDTQPSYKAHALNKKQPISIDDALPDIEAPQASSNLFDDAYSPSVLSSLDEIEESSSSTQAEKLTVNPPEKRLILENITPPLGAQ